MRHGRRKKLLLFGIITLLLLLSSKSTALKMNRTNYRTNSITDRSHNLEIDTSKINETDMFNYSSYLGGSDGEETADIATDKQGNYILVGSTRSSDFPVLNAFNETYDGQDDGFIAKFSPSWEPLNITLFGGSDYDTPGNVHVTSNGYLVTGQTFSNDFPLIDNRFSGSSTYGPDIFMAFFDFSVDLVWTEVIGGSAYDNFEDSVHVTTPFANYTYIVGRTQSSDFPVNSSTGLYNSLNGTHDGFIIRYNMYHRQYIASYYGSSGYDTIKSITSDSANNVIITGSTSSIPNNDKFPTTDNAYQTDVAGGDDMFITKIGESSTYSDFEVHWSTLFGEYDYDNPTAIATDSHDNIIIGGTTSSYNISIKNAYDDTLNDQSDLILIKFNQFGSLLMSTFVGGSQRDFLDDMVIDEQDRIILLSGLNSFDFPLIKPYSDKPYPDGFYYQSSVISVFSSYPTDEYDWRRSELLFSSITSDYASADRGRLAIDGNKILLTTKSGTNLTTTSDAFQSSLNGFSDVGIQSIYHPLMDHDNDGFSTIDEVLNYSSPVSMDTDDDGMPDGFEFNNNLDPITDDSSDDKDNDGMPNFWEYSMDLSPSDASDSSQDKDSDFLINLQEYKLGTNALISDTDGDGLLDGNEVHKYLTDPTTADTDGDGVDDGVEVLIDHTDPLNPPNDNGDNINDTSDNDNTSNDENNLNTENSFVSISFTSIITGSIVLAVYRIRKRYS